MSSNISNPPIFSREYDSGNQTITSAGGLTLAHSLGRAPKIVHASLKCTTAEYGYAIGDEASFEASQRDIGASSTRGCAISWDATNIYVRYANDGANTTFNAINDTTGDGVVLTNANWRLILRAYV